MSADRLPASFRDPSGFVFILEGEIYRQINQSYANDYDHFVSSGLYDSLVTRNWLVEHEEHNLDRLTSSTPDSAYKIIKPAAVPYISYPYEWSFSQLQDAALLTLQVQKEALQRGMTLKDASAYNVQFIGSRPVFIDTLSFERYVEDSPWVAYRQYCQHFLGPLALMGSTDVRLRHMLRSFIDGLPIDLVSKLLPRRSLFRYGLLSHIHMHAASQRRHQNDFREGGKKEGMARLSKQMHLALIDSLLSATGKCHLPDFSTEWGDYYSGTNYSGDSMVAKERLVAELVDRYFGKGQTIHDLGSNTGQFSRLVAGEDRYVVSYDIDELAVERNYLTNKAANNTNVLALLLDLSNPSPAQGWGHAERDSFAQRAGNEFVMALALVHHLAIGNNLPFNEIASFFSQLGDTLIVEFIPKEDSQVQRLLASRRDIFADYSQLSFEQEFGRFFEIKERHKIPGSRRVLYAMERNRL